MKKNPTLAPDAEKASNASEKGDALTLAHARKPGAPIFLRIIRDKNGGLSHMEPLNLTTAQKEQ